MTAAKSWVARLAASALAGFFIFGPAAHGQELRTTHVAGNVYMITGGGGNVTVQAGDEGVLLVDTGATGISKELLQAVREISTRPIQYIINTGVDRAHTGGNEALRAAGETFTGGNATAVAGIDVGAKIIAHENALHRVAAADSPDLAPVGAWPTDTFFVRKTDLYFNGEPVEIIYQPNAIGDSDLIVHFRRSDVISTGDIYRLDSYPVIDVERAGSIQGVLAGLNAVIDLAVPDYLSEGGTMIIPGHGRVSDEADLVRYRDMVTIIRDRVQALIDEGRTLDEIQSSEVTLAYDSRYGSTAGPWTTEMFIEAVYQGLTSPPTAEARR